MSEKFILPEDAKGASFNEMVAFQETIVARMVAEQCMFIEKTIKHLLRETLGRKPGIDDFKKIIKVVEGRHFNRKELFYFDGVGLGYFTWLYTTAGEPSSITFTPTRNLPPLPEPPKIEPQFGEWISVNDRLPERPAGHKSYFWSCDVIICVNGVSEHGVFKYEKMALACERKYFMTIDDMGGNEVQPTHWMPLPEPPKTTHKKP